MYLCGLGQLPASMAQLFSPQYLDLIWTWVPLVNEKRSSGMPSQYPHWPALRARVASIEGKGQQAVTRPDNPPTTEFLHSQLTSSEANPIKAGSREGGMDSATQSWDQGKKDSRYQKTTQSTRRSHLSNVC